MKFEPIIPIRDYMSTLYLVATPIGNLEDLTHRAVRILRDVTMIAAEDTRHTGKLLAHYHIESANRLVSFHDHSDKAKLQKIVAALDEGDIALVSDAGTPGINDPGFALVQAAINAGHTVSPIPGPSAPLAALTASGLPSDSFFYFGYLPRKSAQRQRDIKAVESFPSTLIFLETPHRLVDALGDLVTVLGDREIVVAREMTKLHEEFFRGKISEAIYYFTETPPRGEITLVVAGVTSKDETWSFERLQDSVRDALASNEKPSQIARRLSTQSGWKRRDIYNLTTELQE